MIVLDTSFLVALFSERDRFHEQCATWYRQFKGELLTSPFVLAELDYLLASKHGARVRLYDMALSGLLTVVASNELIDASLQHAKGQSAEEVGLTDASLVVLAEHLATNQIATLDQRHFRALKPLTGAAAFTLIPFDQVA